MDSLGKIVTRLSGQMNDQKQYREFTRWSREAWVDYLNQALREIGAYRPDAYATDITVSLVPGSVQKAAGNIRIDSFGAVSNGNIPNVTDAQLFKAFAAYAACVTPPPKLGRGGQIQYTMRSIALDSEDADTFYVSPPVPAGLNLTIIAKVAGEPPQYTLADWDKPIAIASKYFNNMLDFARARAYELDTESQVSQRTAQILFANFYNTMGVKYRMDSAFGSGYYKGEVGTGDSRSRT